MSVGVRRSSAIAFLLVAVVAAGCAGAPPPVPLAPATGKGPALPTESFDVRAGIEQIYVTGADAGETFRLTSDGRATVEGAADRLGSLVFRQLQQGATYTVANDAGTRTRTVRVLTVDDHPSDAFYRSTSLQEGLNYLPTRDGTLLAVTVRPPVGQSLSDGPFPTVIEYSGYAVASPQDPLADRVARLFDPEYGNDPLVPGGETAVGSLLVRLAGYATVSVQLRGTGCSGGEADLFDLPSRYDGYDVVETLARQPWVLNGRPGMVGISFSGFSQIATASTRPPHLAGIVPMSFLGRFYDVGWPGGVFNVGFADTWVAGRQANARPAPDPGAMPYANALVATDPYCRANQRLRLQTRDASSIFRDSPQIGPDYQARDFTEMLDRIDVPTFALLQDQDEQTSSYAMLGLDRLTSHNRQAWVTLTSGRHNDAISPDTITDVFQFLDIYVARRGPEIKFGVPLVAPFIWDGPTSFRLPSLAGLTPWDAQRRWEERPQYTFGVERPDADGTQWSFTSSSFPAPEARTATWYLSAGGQLSPTVPDEAAASYVSDPTRRPGTQGDTSWSSVPSGFGTGFVSPVLTQDTVVSGPVGADLWLSSTAAATDLQVTITEVRPDGQEQLVNSGVQRATYRNVRNSDPTRPDIDFSTSAPLEPGANRVRVQVLPFTHAFRAGSRIRIVVGPVGGDKNAWRYISTDSEQRPTNTILMGGSTPSSVSLPVVPGVQPPAGLPACPGIAQPCRPYSPLTNGG